MDSDRAAQAEFGPEGWRRAEGYRVLSFQIFSYVNQGLPRRDFLRKIATLIIEFSKCDALDICVAKDDKHYRCSVARAGKDAFSYRRMPFALGAAECPESTDMDRLVRIIVERRFDAASPHFTANGSFWTGDTFRTHVSTLGTGRERGLQVEGGFRSLVVIPIEFDGQCVGIMVLKNMKGGFFDENQIEFYEDIAQIVGIALAYRSAQIGLRERVKELTCLYGIAREVARPDASLEEIIGGIVELLPPGWLYPEIASARIVLDGKAFTTTGFRESAFSQVSDIMSDGRRVGFVEVAYSEKRPELDEGPFLTEERNLIDNIAGKVGQFYERRKAEEEASHLQEQLRHADRLATIGQLAAGVAHELNEPLGNILGFAQLASRTPDLPDQTGKDLAKIITASLHAKEIIKKLMVFARELPPKLISVDLNRVAEEALYFFDARCSKAGIELVRRFAPDLPRITADPGQLNQILVNLVVNAVQAMPDGGTLIVETRAENGQVSLIVEDTGMGMSDEVREQIFIPFFTTKDVNEGTGLGLPVVHGIVTSHKGVISVDSAVGRGARFEIRLPVSGPENSEEIK